MLLVLLWCYMPKKEKLVKIRKSITMYPHFWEVLDKIAEAMRYSRSQAMEFMVLVGSENIPTFQDKKELRTYLESTFVNLITKLENERRILPVLKT